jgi:hypothetical protein
VLYSAFFFLGITLVSVLESESGFEIITQPADTSERPSLYLYSMRKLACVKIIQMKASGF